MKLSTDKPVPENFNFQPFRIGPTLSGRLESSEDRLPEFLSKKELLE